MFKKISIIALSIFIVNSLFLASFARAVDSKIGLAISPPLVEKSINPGESISGVIKVTNVTDQKLNVTTSKKYFTASGEGGEPSIQDNEDTTYTLSKWIDIEKEFTLDPEETKNINYTIHVPDNAEAGGHYSVVLFTPSATENGNKVSGSAVSAVSQIGSLFLVTVTGNINYNGQIVDFSSSKKIYVNSTNLVDLVTRFQNLSTIHVKPQGNITIKNAFGKTVSSLVFNEKSGNVLPDSIRKFNNDWTKKYGFGWYKANINLTYGAGQTAAANLIFWIIPWKETTGAIVAIILVIWLFSRLQWKRK